MTKEQAIKRCKEIIITKFNLDYSIDRNDKEAIETVLSMLKQNSAEIEQKNTELAEKNAEIETLNRQIDLMAEQLAGLTIWDNKKEEPLILTDKEEVIKYFERKSEE